MKKVIVFLLVFSICVGFARPVKALDRDNREEKLLRLAHPGQIVEATFNHLSGWLDCTIYVKGIYATEEGEVNQIYDILVVFSNYNSHIRCVTTYGTTGCVVFYVDEEIAQTFYYNVTGPYTITES